MNTSCWKGRGCRATSAWREHNESGVIKDNHYGVQGAITTVEGKLGA